MFASCIVVLVIQSIIALCGLCRPYGLNTFIFINHHKWFKPETTLNQSVETCAIHFQTWRLWVSQQTQKYAEKVHHGPISHIVPECTAMHSIKIPNVSQIFAAILMTAKVDKTHSAQIPIDCNLKKHKRSLSNPIAGIPQSSRALWQSFLRHQCDWGCSLL